MATMEERRAIVRERMERRAEERNATVGQRRAEQMRHGHQNENENAPIFMDRLTADAERVKARLVIEELRQLSPEEQTAVFSEAGEAISMLSRRLTESTMFLPAFDVELSRELIIQCQQQLAEARQLLQPKKKFTFGRSRAKRTGAAASPKPPPADLPDGDPVPAPEKPKPAELLGDYGVSQRSNEPEEIELRECAGKDLFLSQLTNCRVRLGAGGKAMRVDGLRDCRVVCGPTAGSIFIDDCEDCVFVVACQQLRIHTTHRTAFYIHVTSKAIVEFCSELQFAPYLVTPGQEEEPDVRHQLVQVGLNPDVNNWDKVEDFCHLALDVASPNWRVMEEDARQDFRLF